MACALRPVASCCPSFPCVAIYERSFAFDTRIDGAKKMARRPLINPRKNASQERSRATVDALVEATARILVREGFDKASTNRIAEVAGGRGGAPVPNYPT